MSHFLVSNRSLNDKKWVHNTTTEKRTRTWIQINLIFNIDIDIANFEKSILILILLKKYILKVQILKVSYYTNTDSDLTFSDGGEK